MRDALSTLEQLSVFGDGSVRIDDARALLGEVASTVLSEFACKMAVRDTVGLFGLIRAQVDEGNDLQELTRDLIAHIRDVCTAAIAGPCAELFDGTPEEVAALVEEARLFEGADRLSRALTVLDDAALEMRNATDPRLVLEIACTRLARPESDLTLEALAERIATPEEVAALVEEARLFEGADRLSRALTVLDDAALEMRNATDPRLVLEIACTRLARPESDLTLEALAERIARLEAQIASGVPSAPMSAEQLASATRPKAAPALQEVRKAAPAPASARAAAPTSAPTSACASAPALHAWRPRQAPRPPRALRFRRRCRSRPRIRLPLLSPRRPRNRLPPPCAPRPPLRPRAPQSPLPPQRCQRVPHRR